MADISTRWDQPAGHGDWALSLPQQMIWTDGGGNVIIDQLGRPVSATFDAGDGLLAGDDLLTAVLISLFSDAQAGPDDTIPDGTDDPRGWWAGPIGSRIWLRMRARAVPLTLALVKHDIEQALAWLVDDDVAASVDVVTEWTRPGLLGARVVIRRTDGTTRALGYAELWETI